MSQRAGRLRRGWERVRTEPGLWRNVTVLTALILVATLTGGYVLSQQRVQWPWESRFVFQTTFQDVPGVSPGNGQEVRVAGAKVGTIDAADVDERGLPRLTLSVSPDIEVHRNATVVLRPKSPLNEMYVELNPGGPPAKRLPEDGVLPPGNSQRPIQIDEALGHLDTGARDALGALLSESDVALAGAPQNLPGGVTATDKVVQRLKPVVEALRTRRESLRQLVTALSQISQALGKDGARLGELAGSLDSTLNALGDKDDDLRNAVAQLPDFSRQLRDATNEVQGLSGQLDPALDNLKNASGTLPGALNRLSGTVDQVGKTVDSGTPVVEKAAPVVHDLRPFVDELNPALPDLKSVTGQLDRVTRMLVPSLNDLGAFMINTRSLTSLEDANGGILRGFLVAAPQMVPGDPLRSLSTPAEQYRFPQ